MSKQKQNTPKLKNLLIEGLKLLNFFKGYSDNFKQNKRDLCAFLKSILLEFFKKVYHNLLCVQKKTKKKKKKEKLKQRNQMKKYIYNKA